MDRFKHISCDSFTLGTLYHLVSLVSGRLLNEVLLAYKIEGYGMSKFLMIVCRGLGKVNIRKDIFELELPCLMIQILYINEKMYFV